MSSAQRHENGAAGTPAESTSAQPAEGVEPVAVSPSRGSHADVRVVAVRVLATLAGVWLALAPVVLGHPDTGPGSDARWNDLLVGAAVVAVSVAQLAIPTRAPALSLITFALGSWLIAAPFVLGYNTGGAAVGATVNDIVVGIVVVELAVAAAVLDRRRRSPAR
ncbi:SPW repeat protein [Pseudonocardia sp. H11422]|uniref:SPW repeat domain-containing protein n=1 Tax=Pseudonocardia sp. H11422 TaxID=2835866 RepID=UPI001BDC31F4|nr:SPW repeat protein [Pseudonocardia sp. H11422]